MPSRISLDEAEQTIRDLLKRRNAPIVSDPSRPGVRGFWVVRLDEFNRIRLYYIEDSRGEKASEWRTHLRPYRTALEALFGKDRVRQSSANLRAANNRRMVPYVVVDLS